MSNVETTPTGSPESKPKGRVFLVVGVLLIAVVGAMWWVIAGGGEGKAKVREIPLAGDPRRGEAYVGARACAECHPGEYAHYTGSGHARTLRLAEGTARAAWLEGKTVEDPEWPGAAWRFGRERGRLVARRSGGEGTASEVYEYAFGSGHHAQTFLTITDPDPHHPTAREQRFSYFAATDRLDVTPGQKRPDPEPVTSSRGRDLSTSLTRKCFDCHTTLSSSRGNAVLDPATLVPNVSCERCHGPGRAHVEAARRGEEDLAMPLGPKKGWTAEEQVRSCGHCHRLPEMGPPSAIRPDNPTIVRFQPVGLMQSACYTKSAGALSCSNCHDPHAPASSDRRVYEAACLKCHQEKPQAVCPVSPSQGCLDCHMKRRNAGQGIEFTDHWIRRR